ncbi:MAG TPA: TetR family transcriptional regulator [Microscillaceae bacterium]|jgi:AcrR family transcriptional regulator|nr:TetR family transcriptional regulator [Microscillaceae bacterium]
MSIQARKEREKLEMRTLILKAAKDLFLVDGFEKTSIRNIAEKIEYSPGTIYQYFDDKDDIFLTIHIQAFDRLMALFNKVSDIANPFERLREIGKIYVEFALGNPEMYDLMFSMRAPMASLQAKKEEWGCGFEAFDFLKQTLQECIEQGLIRFQNTELATISIWAHVHGLVSLYIHERFQMLPPEQVSTIIHTCMDNMMELIKKE